MKLFYQKFIHSILFGCIYFTLESMWKGYLTDYRMFILSGLIGLGIGCINELFTYDTDLILQCIVGMMIALLCECIFGYQWNIIEQLELWDYSTLPFSAVENQINLFFAIIWIFLSLVCVLLDDAMHYYIWKDDEVPYYRIKNKIFYFPKR